MDAELKDGMLKTTVAVRRPTAISRTGSETLAAAVTLNAYVENEAAWVPTGNDGAQRVSQHVLVLDAADVAASSLLVLHETDRFWLEGQDPLVSSFGRKGKITKYKEFDSTALSHYEVEL